jgi:hypothetical protein
MWIKWKYNDHGWSDFQELEIPNDIGGYENVKEYLCDQRELNIPTWSERFMLERVVWEKLELAPEEIRRRRINVLKSAVTYHEHEMKKALDEILRLC